MMNSFISNRFQKNSLLIAVLFFLFLTACVESQKPEKKVTKYFDVEGLLDQQVQLLSETPHKVRKHVELDEKTEEKTVTLDKESWEKELKSFYELDLNRAVLADAYTIKDEQTAEGHTLRYEALEPEKVKVQYLQIWLDAQERPVHLEARYEEDNRLFHSSKDLMASFGANQKNVQLTKYQVEGSQKLVLKDSLTFRLNAEVLY